MKILYYDCFAGISGDMNLGALVDAGVPFDYLKQEISKLNIEDLELKASKKGKMGIYGTKVDVIYSEGHCHRNIEDIKDIIFKSDLSIQVKERAMKMFMLIGEAEAKVHNKTIEDIHFHEVGAMDSIADVVGAAICIEYLDVDQIWSGAPELGGGFVRCAHGMIPVPAPAVCEIVKGIPTRTGKVEFETTTPTGAAILKGNVDRYLENPQLNIQTIGYGLGNRDMEIPNVLRVFIGSTVEEKSGLRELSQEMMIECNIDDMSGERFKNVMDELFKVGAKDVFMDNIIMKKSRPGIKLSVLCESDLQKEVAEIIFKHTTSIGIRKYVVEKVAMKRDTIIVETPWGDVQVKRAYIDEERFKYKAEYSQVEEIIKKNDVTFKEIDEVIMNRVK